LDQSLSFFEEERPSDSPLIERIWHSQSDQNIGFHSRAEYRSEIVIATHQGRTTVWVRGPETLGTPASVAADSECIGIVFKVGTFMPSLLPQDLMDRRDSELPSAGETRFWLEDQRWEVPTYENADAFVSRLVRQKLLVRDFDVASLVQDPSTRLSKRAVQYRVLRATGLPLRTLHQIERAQQATALLRRGASILDTVCEAGYFDQSHLTRAMKRFVGLTPLEVARASWTGSLLTRAGSPSE